MQHASSLTPNPRPGTTIARHLTPLALTGLLLALAFPQPGWAWLAHGALVPAAIIALRSNRPRRLAWTTYLVGVAWWLLMVRWLIPVTVGGYIGLSFFYGLHWLVGLMALRWLDRKYRRMPMTLALPMVWTSLEMIRSHWPSGGFGWFALGHSQAAWRVGDAAPILAQSADLFGELTVSFLVAMTSGLIVDLLVRPWFTTRRGEGGGNGEGRGGRFSYTLRWSLTLWILCVGGAMFYGQWRIKQTPVFLTPGPRVAVVQTNVPQDNKNQPSPATDRAMWDQLVSLTRQAMTTTPPTDGQGIAAKPDLIVWPETMVPASLNVEAVTDLATDAAFWRNLTVQDISHAGDPAAYERLAKQRGVTLEALPTYLADWLTELSAYRVRITELSRELDTPLLVGATSELRNDRAETYTPNDLRFNSVYLAMPAGWYAERYDKIHRVPFGEYIPWIDAWPWLKGVFMKYLSPYESDYTLTPGSQLTLFQTQFVSSGNEAKRPLTFATPVCFEDAIARLTRRMVYGEDGQKRADMLINLTNDGWYAAWDQPPQHLQLATLRCIELRVPMARSVNTGISGFIDSLGRIEAVVTVNGQRQEVAGVASHNVSLDSRVTLFARWGELPMWGLTIITGLLIVLAPLVPKRRA